MNNLSRTISISIITGLAGAAILLGGMYIGRTTFAPSRIWPAGMIGNIGPAGRAGSWFGPGMMNLDMMAGHSAGGLIGVEPVSLADAEQAVEDYLAAIDGTDFELAEIMIFENHAYAQIVEKSTGIGAMELLIDPVTRTVYPEHGPNMMWNLKYSQMSGFGMMGISNMMGGWAQAGRSMMGYPAQPRSPEDVSAEMP